MRFSTELHEDHIITMVEVSVEEISARENPFGVTINAPGLSACGQPGAPALPRTRVNIGVPPGLWPRALEVEEGE